MRPLWRGLVSKGEWLLESKGEWALESGAKRGPLSDGGGRGGKVGSSVSVAAAPQGEVYGSFGEKRGE